jgi:hypothetical protein
MAGILSSPGKLWRMSNPQLEPQHKAALVRELMEARRAVKDTRSARESAQNTLTGIGPPVRRK